MSAFKQFLARLVRVPKREIEEQDRKFRNKRDADEYKGQRRPVVPSTTALNEKAGRKARPTT